MKHLQINSNKIALLSDVHWGKSRDSDIKINVLIEYFNWYLDILKEQNIDTIFFLGDWFDNRNLISVKTQNQAYDILKQLSDNNIKVYMIVGNHDAYFKNTIHINSIKPFSDIKNIFPIQELTEITFNSNDKKGLLCPWDTFDSNNINSKYDIMFGHFEFQGAYLNDSVSFGNISVSDLLEISPLVFCGHYHIRNEYIKKNGKLITVGCPVELDWGDYNNEKGIYIVDMNTLNISYIKNDKSPKHIKLYWSKVKENIEDFSLVKNNYIKFVIDCEYNFEHIMKIINEINALGPLRPCETDLIYNNALNALDDISFDVDDKILSISKLDYMIKYIQEFTKNTDKLDIDIEKMIAITKLFYKNTELE